jgi:hypothetical protein
MAASIALEGLRAVFECSGVAGIVWSLFIQIARMPPGLAPAPRLRALQDYSKKLTRGYRNAHDAHAVCPSSPFIAFTTVRFFRTPASAFAGLSDRARP